MDVHDITGAKVLVRFLCRNGLRWLRRSTPLTSWSRTFETIGDTFSIYSAADAVDSAFLPDLARGESLAGEIDGPHILLEPPSGNQHVVCLLGIRWALDDASTHMTLYLHTFGQSQRRGVKAWHRGYRLELPHSRGAHTYTHVQPTTTVGWTGRTLIPFEDPGVIDAFPSFPLRGHNLTTLCAALAVALHGIGALADVVEQLKGHRFQNLVRNLLRDGA